MVDVRSIEDQRRTERLSTTANVRVRIYAQEIAGTLFNISAAGAKVGLSETVLDAIETAPVTLRIPGFGEFDGKIIWNDEEVIGMEFLENHKALAHIIHDYRRI